MSLIAKLVLRPLPWALALALPDPGLLAAACQAADLPTGCDSPGIAPQGACPAPNLRKALPGPPQNLQHCASTLNHFHIAFMGRPLACPDPEPWEPSLFLRACCTLLINHSHTA